MIYIEPHHRQRTNHSAEQGCIGEIAINQHDTERFMASGKNDSLQVALPGRIKWHLWDKSAGGSAGTKVINVDASDVLFLVGCIRFSNGSSPTFCMYCKAGTEISAINVTTSGGKIAFAFNAEWSYSHGIYCLKSENPSVENIDPGWP